MGCEGNKYLDLLTGWGVFALGRNHPKVKAIMQQLLNENLPNLVRMDCGLLSGLVAEKLTSHTTDGLSRVFFCNSGTEAVESALKFARCATGRQDVVYCDHAFHGLTGWQRFRSTGPTSSANGLVISRPARGQDPVQRPIEALERALGQQESCRVHRRTGPGKKLRSGRTTDIC